MGTNNSIRSATAVTAATPAQSGGASVRQAQPPQAVRDDLRMSRVLQTSAPRVEEIYAAFDDSAAALSERAAMRMQRYRRFLTETVVSASPLLFDALSPEEATLALHALVPPRYATFCHPIAKGWWRAWESPHQILNGKNAHSTPIFGGRVDVDAAFARAFRAGGHIVRVASDPAGALGIRPIADCMEVMLLIRGTLVMSWRGQIRVATMSPIPETLATAALGRPLGALVDSPLFNGREYRIRKVCVEDGMTVITAFAAAQPLSLAKTFAH